MVSQGRPDAGGGGRRSVGKSTLAKRLAGASGLPHMRELDAINWQAGLEGLLDQP